MKTAAFKVCSLLLFVSFIVVSTASHFKSIQNTETDNFHSDVEFVNIGQSYRFL